MTRPNATKSALLFAITMGLASCSSAPQNQNDPAYAAAKSSVASFEQEMTDARSRHLGVLAPETFAKAEESLKDAKSAVAKNKDAGDISKSIQMGQSELANAKTIAERDQGLVTELTTARAEAVAAKAPSLAPDSFTKAEKALKSEMEDFESGKAAKTLTTDTRKKIVELYSKAQIEALKKDNLAEMKAKLAMMEDKGANSLIPNALTETKNKIASAEVAIEGNRNNQSVIASTVANAKMSFNRTLELFDRARNIKSGSTESAALALLKRDDSNANLNQQLNQTETNLAQTKESLNSANQQARKLLSASETQAYVASLQKRFTKGEAEVFQQGNNVLIRLKGIRFKTNKSEIPDESVALLDSVKETLKELGQKDVVVEGHTDSVGGKDQNMKLSQGRADAIKDYFQADTSLSKDQITAKGYGFEKPLTTNKTAFGRSQNRRVDIVIEDVTGTQATPPTKQTSNQSSTQSTTPSSNQ